MTDEAIQLREKIEYIRIRLNTNKISYEEAKEEAAPVIEEINRIGAEVAKRFNKRPIKLNFVSLMR